MAPPAPSAPRPRRRGRQLLLFAVATCLALVAAEVVVRIVAWAGEARRREAWYTLAEAPRLAAGREAQLMHLIRPSRDDRRVYELIPGLDVRFVGQRVCTDGNGCRVPSEPLPAVAAPRRTVRIVGLGDSVMFGWGVRAEDSFLRVLQQALQQRHPDVDWQVRNTAVPGYNTVMEVATLRGTALAPPPQLVVVDLVDNDLDLPNFIAHETDYTTLSTSFLLEWVESVRRGFDTQAFRPFALAPKRGEGLFVGDPERVPARYRDLVGPGPFARALAELAALGREHGFAVVATSHLFFADEHRRALQQAGLRGVETGPAVQRHQAAHGIADYRGALTVRPDDPHPNEVVHRLQAEAILAELTTSGVLAQLVQ